MNRIPGKNRAAHILKRKSRRAVENRNLKIERDPNAGQTNLYFIIFTFFTITIVVDNVF